MSAFAVVFDLDGLLIDSEPLWREAEIELFGTVGVALTPDLCRTTMGLRVDEVTRHWFARRPWRGPSPAALARLIVARMETLLEERGALRPGAAEAVASCREAGFRLALASSSSYRLIFAALRRNGLEDAFAVVHSAEEEALGKPHPAVYLDALRRLGAAPGEALALEDSLGGVVAAKAARMAVVVVPEDPRDPRFALADAVLGSLEEFTPQLALRLLAAR